MAAQRRHLPRVAADFGDPAPDERLHDDVAGDLEFIESPLTDYLAARTLFFDSAVVDAIAAGCRQVVVAGSGYDGRSLRYSHESVRWFELDHPATLADKWERLVRLDVAVIATPVAADFAVDDVGDVLAAAGHDLAVPSLMFCEGVTPYLEPDAVVRLLSALRGRAANGSRLAIDLALVPSTEEARAARAALGGLVRSIGEPFRFEVPADSLAGLLAESGWTLERAIDPSGVDLASSSASSAFVLAFPLD